MRKRYAGSSPAWPTEGADHDLETGPAHRQGPLAQWQSGRLLISRFSGFESPAAYNSMRRWRNGKRVRLLSGRSGFNSSAARSCSVGVNGHLTTRPSTWRLRVRTPHGALETPSSMGLGSEVFTLGNRARLPVGVTARSSNPHHRPHKPAMRVRAGSALPIPDSSTAERPAVNRRI
jgi:hypothetical protein